MALHEQTFNQIFGETLRLQFRSWQGRARTVRIESSGQLVSGRGRRPDVVVVPSGGYPVVFEGAFEDTHDVDRDARERCGEDLENPHMKVFTSFVIVIPKRLRAMDDVVARDVVESEGFALRYAIFTQGPDGEKERFPSGGYAEATMPQLAALASICSVPSHLINARIESTCSKIETIAGRMGAVVGEGVRQRVADILRMVDQDAALRVCVCIWLDAFLAQERLSDVEESFRGTSQFFGVPDSRLQERVHLAWEDILGVNYRAIFLPARDTLAVMSGSSVGKYLHEVLAVARDVVQESLHHILDIGGELLPRLAPDRKATAAFYTLRESADLLTGLVPEECYRELARQDRDHKAGLVGDFACGTGSLLVSAYRRIRREIDASQSLPDARHRWWMEEGLFGVDIQPIAVHLTAMRLSSFAMGERYERANIIYAGLDGGKTGALELLDRPKLLDLFPLEDGKDADDMHAPAPDGRFGLVVMNPPYTAGSASKEGGRKGGAKMGVFSVGQLDADGQKVSGDRYKGLIKGTFANGRAGMASSFAALADKKLMGGGAYASVLPATAAGGSSWADFRENFRGRYSGVLVVSMASAERHSFSADTGMEELLVVAQKGEVPRSPFHFISLYEFPRNAVETEAFVHAIRQAVVCSRPGLPTRVCVGVAVVGDCLAYTVSEGEVWAPANVRDLSLVGYANRFHRYAGMQPLGDIFSLGLIHLSIGHVEGGSGHGAFMFRPVAPGVMPRHPSLWEKSHETQRTILTAPTHDGEPVPGREDLQRRVLVQRSQLFWGKNLGFGSQVSSVAGTASLCMGGGAWAGLRTEQQGLDKAVCLWANSIFGLVWRWLYGGKQQAARSMYQIEAIKKFRIPRFDERAIRVAADRFDELVRLPLRPCAYAQWDGNRRRIDAVVREMLGFGEDMDEATDQLRRRWCAEPGVHGGKKELVALLERGGVS